MDVSTAFFGVLIWSAPLRWSDIYHHLIGHSTPCNWLQLILKTYHTKRVVGTDGRENILTMKSRRTKIVKTRSQGGIFVARKRLDRDELMNDLATVLRFIRFIEMHGVTVFFTKYYSVESTIILSCSRRQQIEKYRRDWSRYIICSSCQYTLPSCRALEA